MLNLMMAEIINDHHKRRIAMIKRTLHTKAQMLDLGFKVGGDPNGHYWVTRNGRVAKSIIISTPHPHGKEKAYRAFGIYVPKDCKVAGIKPMRGILVLEHVLIWIWFMGDIPDGMEIDHIDGCGQNNHLYNLRLITHAENIKAGASGRNQYTGCMTDDELQDYKLKKLVERSKTNIGKFGHHRGRPSKKLLAAVNDTF